MGLFSGSKSSTDVTNVQETVSQQLGFEDIEGNATSVIAGKGASVEFTDHGAVSSALGFANDLGADAFQFGANALATANVATQNALLGNLAVSDGALDVAQDLGARTISASTGALANTTQSLGSSFNRALTSVTEGQRDDAAVVLGQITKSGTIVFVAAAAAVAVFFWRRR